MHLTDRQIEEELKIVEAAKANPERFGVLYEKYYKQIFLFVYKRTDEEELAADLTAQVFVKAMMNLSRYEFKGVPFSAWLYRIASNEVNQHFRSTKGQRVVSMETDEMKRVLKVADEEIPSISEDDIRILMETLQDLGPDEIQLIELRFFEDKPFKEVAFILGLTETNAKVKLYRILERLKKKLKQKLVGR